RPGPGSLTRADALVIRTYTLTADPTTLPFRETTTTMAPNAVHTKDAILDAARELVLERGVQHATVSAISEESGAPVGSLYHHFGSRGGLVAELGGRGVPRSQATFLAAARRPNAEAAAVGAALSIHDFAREHRDDARQLVSFRREDLLHDTPSPRLRPALPDLEQPL